MSIFCTKGLVSTRACFVNSTQSSHLTAIFLNGSLQTQAYFGYLHLKINYFFALYYSYCSKLLLSVNIRSENLPIHLVFCLPKVVIKSMHKTKELRSDFVISDNVFGPIVIHANFRKNWSNSFARDHKPGIGS